jgi:UDP-2-acetamido-2,6-beta-L-arabino-hexul-4-ose reductase
MRILVTGADGFIGKNLLVRLKENSSFKVSTFSRCDSEETLKQQVFCADAIFHLAGENRPESTEQFDIGNRLLTQKICDLLRDFDKKTPIILSSSLQAELDNPYGASKRAAEVAVRALASENGNPVAIYRLPGVFGKWCKPNYNSVVATFCHNIAHGLPIQINNPDFLVKLVYIDDVVSSFLEYLDGEITDGVENIEVKPEYSSSLKDLAFQINQFKNCRSTLITEKVGSGFVRALYSTYVSYLPNEKFTYKLNSNVDNRGVFVEMLKTKDSGQFSYFTAHPGVTRGGHYHHTKTEKFLVIKGNAEFRFCNILTGERYNLETSDSEPMVVETIPGWAHDITNIGDDELIVMLWANEIFDHDKPDTIMKKIENEKA